MAKILSYELPKNDLRPATVEEIIKGISDTIEEINSKDPISRFMMLTIGKDGRISISCTENFSTEDMFRASSNCQYLATVRMSDVPL